MSSNSAVKYEGTWANGLQDGYGCETYANGGYYQGQMCRGLRHGYGVRKSAPYGDSNLTGQANKVGSSSMGQFNSQSMMIHSNSLQSSGSVELDPDDSPKLEDGFKPNIDRTIVSKNGFVLVAKPLDVPMPAALPGSSSRNNGDNSSPSHLSAGSQPSRSRRNSLTNKLALARIPGSNQTVSLLRGLRLKKQKSTSDLDGLTGRSTSGQDHRKQGSLLTSQVDSDLPNVPFTLSPEELDITDPTTVETYTGEWKQDKRNGYGVCDRSDGLKYEGQWHNDMKCGYGVTTFKDGSKEEGKYKNNILIVDSKVKRFFQLGSSNIRQRIDDAVRLANQAQTMALKKAEIADTRAATARDKADQATTAALEADRDSQIAYSVARQYSDSQMQQNQSAFGNYGSPFMSGPYNIHEPVNAFDQPMMANLGLGASNALQMRRLSQQQFNSSNRLQQNHINFGELPGGVGGQLQNSTQLDQGQQAQHLGLVEPFNGRRGSFRGGSITASTQMKRSPSPMRPPSTSGAGSTQAPSGSFRQVATDPYNDLFDHYKLTSSHSNVSSSTNVPLRARLRTTGKQASLDYSSSSGPAHTGQARAPSVPRYLGSSVYSNESNEPKSLRMRRFRNSSLDQADERAHMLSSDYNPNSEAPTPDSMQQQLRHLVTSGESMQKQQQQNQHHNQPQPTNSGMSARDESTITDQATSSPYILPQSTTSSSYLYNNSANQTGITPSPDSSSIRSPSSQQQQHAYHQNQSMTYHSNLIQRDAQSLADERLYLRQSRMSQAGWTPLDRTEFANYDFTISSGPRYSQRCMKRTASLSRNTPIRSDRLRSSTGGSQAGSSNFLAESSQGAKQMQQRTISPAGSGLIPDEPSALQQAQIPAINILNSRACLPTSVKADEPIEGLLEPSDEQVNQRKVSLQVRYDPNELGGLMSREEVAKLSHAQREQRRMQADLAEKRAKKPLLHLCLAFKEFLIHQRLLIAVLIFNTFLFKMFADLIV